jgi:hypothetical protein
MKMAATQLYKYKWPWRHTRKGGITDYIAVCSTCKRMVPPTRTRLSRSGTHGEDYWAHEHELSFIVLKQSNSGIRTVETVGDVPAELLETVRNAWLYENRSVPGIVSLVIDWFEMRKTDDPGLNLDRDFGYFEPDDPEWPCGASPDPDYDPEYAGDW